MPFIDDWPITRQYVTPSPLSKIWIRPCSNHWEKEKSGASTCLKHHLNVELKVDLMAASPKIPKLHPTPRPRQDPQGSKTGTGKVGKQWGHRQQSINLCRVCYLHDAILLYTFFLFYFYWYLIQPCLACPPHELTLQIARGKHVVPLQGSHLLHVVICIYIFSYCHRYKRNAEKIPHLPPPPSTSPPPQTSTQIQKMARSPKT